MKDVKEEPGNPSDDLGLGTKIFSRQRFINKDGSFNVTRQGMRHWSAYQSLVEESWLWLFLQIVFYYLTINALFALLLVYIGVDSISGIERADFVTDLSNAFFFSVQTFTTVGYGALSPLTLGANILSAVIAFIGLLSFALATSLIYARFSKPKAQIIFSEQAVIANYKDRTALMFRMVNKRNHKIIDLQTQVFATWIIPNNGIPKREFKNLGLERNQIFLFPMNWTVVHPIYEDSPFFEKTKEELFAVNLEIIVQVNGYDESYNQTIHANTSYLTNEINWSKKFEPMVTSSETGTIVHLNRLDDVEEDLI